MASKRVSVQLPTEATTQAGVHDAVSVWSLFQAPQAKLQRPQSAGPHLRRPQQTGYGNEHHSFCQSDVTKSQVCSLQTGMADQLYVASTKQQAWCEPGDRLHVCRGVMEAGGDQPQLPGDFIFCDWGFGVLLQI